MTYQSVPLLLNIRRDETARIVMLRTEYGSAFGYLVGLDRIDDGRNVRLVRRIPASRILADLAFYEAGGPERKAAGRGLCVDLFQDVQVRQ